MSRKRFTIASTRITRMLAAALLLNSTFAPTFAAEQNDQGFTAPNLDDRKNFASLEHALVNRFLKAGEYLPVSDIKPGMEGYGLTVFQGTKIEKFNVKVIGTVKKVLNNKDAILVRLSGAGMAKNNVIKGMSGSPVYIGGKLVGAISYGFDFSIEPIAGVTPIVDMLDALAQDTGKQSSGPDRISKIELPTVSPTTMQTSAGVMPTTVSGATPHMVPLMAPVSLSGFSTRAEQFLSEKFGEVGLYCSSGGSGGMDESLSKTAATGKATPKDALTPGSAVAVMLTTGDFTTAATGTTTATFGGKVLAFGHPFLQAGFVDFPMASAFIHQVMPSLNVSFKLSSPMQVLGSIVSDRPWAVGGQIGKFAHMIPATYDVTDETRHLQHTYRCNIVDHPDLTPELMAATAMSAIDATHQSQAPYILKVSSEITTKSGAQIRRTDRFPSNFSVHTNSLDSLSRFKGRGDPVSGYLLFAANKIMDNEFQRESIKAINLKIALEDGHNAAKLERIYVDNPIVEPGDTVKVNCVIRPYDKERVTKTIDLQIPRDVPDGNIVLAVASGDEFESVRRRIGLIDPPPEDLNQILNKIRTRGRSDALCAVLALPEQSISVNGVTLLNPPAHWNKLFFSDRYTRGAVLSKGEVRAYAVQDCLLDGAHVMTVEVRRKDKAVTRSQPLMTAPTSVFGMNDSVSMTDLARKTIGKIDTTSTTTISSTSTSATTSTTAPVVSSAAAADKATSAASSSATAYWSATGNKNYPHMRSIQLWRQENEADFKNGKTDSTTIDSWGRIIPGFQVSDKSQVKNDMRIWSSVWSNGSFWFSTTNKVYKWNGDHNAPVEVAKLPGVAIPSLVADSKGMLYAAAIPGGNVYSIDPNKQANQNTRLVTKLSEPLVTCLTMDNKDNLYIGVTGSGKVYKIGAAKGALPVSIFDSGQADVVSMFFCAPEDKLYVGTAEKGAVYSIDSAGTATAEYQSPDHIVTGIAKDKKGDLYVSTAGTGHLVKMNKNGDIDTLASSDAFYTLYYDPNSDHVFSGDAEGDITEARFDPLSKQSYFVPVSHTEQDAVVTLSADGNGRLFAGTCNLAVAQVFEMKSAAKATYTSEVRDGQRSSKWSRIRAYGGYNEVNETVRKAITVETRTGQTSQPDSSWSTWIAANPAPDAYEIKSPPGRYLQYRLAWKFDETSTGRPVAIGQVDTTYLPNNTAPQISNVSLKSGTAVNGKADITVTGTDSDGDNLLLAMQISPDGGQTWQTVVNELRTKHATKEEAPPEVTATVKAETSTTTEVPDTKNKTAPAPAPKLDGALPPQVQPPGGPPKKWDPESALSEGTVGERSFGEKLQVEPPKDADKSQDAGDKSKDGSKDVVGEAKVEPVKVETKTEVASKKKSKAKLKVKGSPMASVTDASSPSETSGNGEKFTIKWDTTKFKEGNYIAKFTLDDKLSNAEGSEQISVFRTIDVDNTPPQITSVKWTKDKSGGAKLRVEAKDKITPIVNGTYRLDGGEPLALAGINDPGDGLNVVLGADNISYAKNPKKVEIKVLDRAGNSVTKTVDIN
ncbi:MAG: hypothetical protein JST89_02675 [Cyanobacteria bacterium SZAS-4]|nr:hypothetical protein [Cyanobacteria bacterium SZAS-4]